MKYPQRYFIPILRASIIIQMITAVEPIKKSEVRELASVLVNPEATNA